MCMTKHAFWHAGYCLVANGREFLVPVQFLKHLSVMQLLVLESVLCILVIGLFCTCGFANTISSHKTTNEAARWKFLAFVLSVYFLRVPVRKVMFDNGFNVSSVVFQP